MKYDEIHTATLQYFHGDTLATDAWIAKYCLRNKEGEYLERTPEDMHRRLAGEFARVESGFKNPMGEEEIFQIFDRFKYVIPAGSPMFGVGNPYSNSSLSNCFVVPGPKDSISSIFDEGKNCANILKRRGGCGIDLSNLRPDGTSVNNSAITSTGAWSFADFYSYVCRKIGQSGRRGAALVSMDVRHPDILKFVTMKNDKTAVTGANISVKISNEFMMAVHWNEDFELRWPAEGEAVIRKTIRARELWDLIVDSATKTGEPGILFWDTVCARLPAHMYPRFKTTNVNPCVTGDTVIETNGGKRTIEELARKDTVFWANSYNEVTHKIESKSAKAFKTREKSKILCIKLKDGSILKLTKEHLVYTDIGWVEAGRLTKNHKILKY
jgi:ribonucleoside-diphosphate reductase alpha chain